MSQFRILALAFSTVKTYLLYSLKIGRIENCAANKTMHVIPLIRKKDFRLKRAIKRACVIFLSENEKNQNNNKKGKLKINNKTQK